jgi:acetylornithine/succinyldiaminopimelate/putrescine aminotransferase
MMTDRQLFFRHLGQTSPEPPALEFIRAEGIFLFDKAGRAFYDMTSGFSVSNIGHCHPKVVEAVQQQAAKYMHQTVYGEFVQNPQTQLALKLVNLLPAQLDCVYFVNSGSEAIEGAMKLAKRHTGRPNIVSFINAYHGSTQGSLSMLGNETMKQAFRPLIPGIRQIEFNNFGQLEQIDSSCAAVFVEPVQTEAGVILPDEGFLEAVRQRCNETGALLVFDEIQTGFGRCGSMFVFEQYHVIPDILCLAKAMGGGMPIGAFIAPSQLMNKLSFDPVLGHITTFGGHPVSAAAAVAAIDVISSEGLLEGIDEKTGIFIDAIKNHPLVNEIRHKGLMIAFDTDNESTALKALGCLLDNGLISDRFLFRPQALRIAPPLISSVEDCKTMAQLLVDALNKVNS